MPLPVSLEKTALDQMVGRQTSNNDLVAYLIKTMFAPRFVRVIGSTITLDETHRGAILIFPGGSPVTVTLGLQEAGFLCSGIQLGAGAVSVSGTHVGGTTSTGQNAFFSMMTLDDGSWFVSGGMS